MLSFTSWLVNHPNTSLCEYRLKQTWVSITQCRVADPYPVTLASHQASADKLTKKTDQAEEFQGAQDNMDDHKSVIQQAWETSKSN